MCIRSASSQATSVTDACLSEQKRSQVRDVLNSETFQDKSPREIYAKLLDEGRYLCCWRTMYRILAAHNEIRERRNQLQHPTYTKPELLARTCYALGTLGNDILRA